MHTHWTVCTRARADDKRVAAAGILCPPYSVHMWRTWSIISHILQQKFAFRSIIRRCWFLDLNQMAEYEKGNSKLQWCGDGRKRLAVLGQGSWNQTAHLAVEYFLWLFPESSVFLSSSRRSPAASTQPQFTRVCLPGKRRTTPPFSALLRRWPWSPPH